MLERLHWLGGALARFAVLLLLGALLIVCAIAALELYRRLGWLKLLEVVLSSAGALVAIGAANRMDRSTECTIIFAFATTAAGLLGVALANVWPGGWSKACDVLLVGGVAALLVGTRRRTIWLDPAWMPRISLALSAVTWGGFFAGMS